MLAPNPTPARLMARHPAPRARRAWRRQRVLAIASAGGHWIQLLRTMPAFGRHDVFFASTRRWCAADCGNSPFYHVPDASRWNKLKLLWSVLCVVVVVLRVRPDIVISTGAAPGYFAIWVGRLLGAKTIWVDSMANAERLSLSGERAGRHAGVWLTQWPELAGPNGPAFHGRVL